MTRIAEFRRAAEAAPEDGDAWLRLAEVAFEAGDLPEACRAWSRADGLYAGPFLEERSITGFVRRTAESARARGLFHAAAGAYAAHRAKGQPHEERAFETGLALLLASGRAYGGWSEPASLGERIEAMRGQVRERPRSTYGFQELATVLALSGRWSEAVEAVDAWEAEHGRMRVGLFGVVREGCRALAQLGDLRAPDSAAAWSPPSWDELRRRAERAPAGPPPDAFTASHLGERVAAPFRAAAVGADEAARWLEAGYRPTAALEWRARGFDPLDAAPWRARDFAPEEADAWREAGWAAAAAHDWRAAGCGPPDGVRWRDAGFALADVRRWTAAGFELDEAATWHAQGVPARDAEAWRPTGLGPDRVGPLRALGVAPATARQWLDAGFTAEDLVRFHERELDLDGALAERLRLPARERPERAGAFALVFWGVPLPDGTPWGTDADGEEDVEAWPRRLHRLRGTVRVDELACHLGVHGRPKTWERPYAAITESESFAPLEGRRLPGLAEGADWRRRLETFCATLGIDHVEPGWHVAASWIE